MSSVQILLDKQLCILANPQLYPEASGQADGYLSAIGPLPGRGWVLMDRARFDLTDRSKPFEVKFRTDTKELNAELFLKNMFFVSAKRVTVGREGNEGIFMVEFADRRILAERFSAANNQFNVRKEDTVVTAVSPGIYTTESLDGSVIFTWQSMFTKLWDALPNGFSTAPTLPYTPDGTPENWIFMGVSIWESITVILDKLQLAVAHDPIKDTFTVIRFGTTQTGLADAEKKAAQVPSYMKDSEPSFAPITDEPETIRVYFPKRFAPWSSQPIGFGVEVVDVLTNITGTSKGTILPINDDLPALVDDTGAVTNTSALSTRASEVVTNWKNNRDTTRGWRKFPGVLTSILPGSEVKAVWWHYFGPQEGFVTEVAKHPGRLEAMTESGPRWSTLENIAPPDFARKTLDTAPDFFPAITDVPIPSEASGLVSLQEGLIGAEVDSLINVTAFNWGQSAASSGQKVLIRRAKSRPGVWYFTLPPGVEADPCVALCAAYNFNESTGDAIDQGPNGLDLSPVGTVGSTSGVIDAARSVGAPTGGFLRRAHEPCFSIQSIGGSVTGWFLVDTVTSGSPVIIAAKQRSATFEWRLEYQFDSAADAANLVRFIVSDTVGGTITAVDSGDATVFKTLSFIYFAIWVDLFAKTVNLAIGPHTPATTGTLRPTVVSPFSGSIPVDRNSSLRLGVGAAGDGGTIMDGRVDEWRFVSCPIERKGAEKDYNAGKAISHPYGDKCCNQKADRSQDATDALSASSSSATT